VYYRPAIQGFAGERQAVRQTRLVGERTLENLMSDQPRLFIASSSEGLHVAEAVLIKLEHEGRVKLWDNAFDLSSVTINSLAARAKDTDFAVFVFHRDDKSYIRGNIYNVVRDNVLFELGLFVGALGIEKCFILVPKSGESEFHLPTDLAGVTVSIYDDSSDDTVDAVAASCAKIKLALQKLAKAAAASSDPREAKAKTIQQQLQAFESEIYRLRIDTERAQEKEAKLLHALAAHFYTVAKPATDAEILAWEEGAKLAYPKGAKIDRGKVYFVDRDIIIPPLFGSLSISVIVAAGVKVHGLDQWSHNSVYFMDGFRKLE
jgi:predicted nucleotide-binding protein